MDNSDTPDNTSQSLAELPAALNSDEHVAKCSIPGDITQPSQPVDVTAVAPGRPHFWQQPFSNIQLAEDLLKSVREMEAHRVDVLPSDMGPRKQTFFELHRDELPMRVIGRTGAEEWEWWMDTAGKIYYFNPDTKETRYGWTREELTAKADRDIAIAIARIKSGPNYRPPAPEKEYDEHDSDMPLGTESSQTASRSNKLQEKKA